MEILKNMGAFDFIDFEIKDIVRSELVKDYIIANKLYKNPFNDIYNTTQNDKEFLKLFIYTYVPFHIRFISSWVNCKTEGNCQFVMYGPGVEKIFYEVKELFPDKKIKIVSSDYLKSTAKTKNLFKEIKENKINILVGTQMI